MGRDEEAKTDAGFESMFQELASNPAVQAYFDQTDAAVRDIYTSGLKAYVAAATAHQSSNFDVMSAAADHLLHLSQQLTAGGVLPQFLTHVYSVSIGVAKDAARAKDHAQAAKQALLKDDVESAMNELEHTERCEGHSCFFPHPCDAPSQGQEFTTGVGQELVSVHTQTVCEGAYCIIHNPMYGPWRDWKTYWVEAHSVFMRICPCGAYHPAVEEIIRGTLGEQHDCCAKCVCINDDVRVLAKRAAADRGFDGPSIAGNTQTAM